MKMMTDKTQEMVLDIINNFNNDIIYVINKRIDINKIKSLMNKNEDDKIIEVLCNVLLFYKIYDVETPEDDVYVIFNKINEIIK